MNFAKMKVGARMATSFACVLVLLIVVTGVSMWRMQQIGDQMDRLIKDQLNYERLTSEWKNIIDVNGTRTLAAARVDDAAIRRHFEDEIKQSSVRAAEIRDRLSAMTDPVARQLFEDTQRAGEAYRVARTNAFKEKDAGNTDAANKFFDEDMVPKIKAYSVAVTKLHERQQQLIDGTGAEIHGQNAASVTLLIVLSAAAVLLGAGFAFVITRQLLRQLGGEPDYAVEVAGKIAAGDLTAEIAVQSGDQRSLMYAIKAMRDSLANIVGQVRGGTDTIVSASTQIASGNLDLSARTEQQASSLEQTASSMEELITTVRQNADNARQANMLATSASDVAGKGGEVVGQVVQTMGSINESARKIVDIIGVIDGIAFQTNILALNAAVEAARAGEQGKGFAVVAAEVRSLAQRSAGAAREIKELIGDSVEKVDAGAKLVDQAGATMQEIVAGVRRVTDIMGEISAASEEQTAGIQQINQAIAQMDEVTQQNAALVEQASAASEAMKEQANSLAQVVSVFKLDALHANAAAHAARTRNLASVPHAASARKAAAAAALPRPKPAAIRKTANGDDWEEF